ncbi:hypothetical protein DIPPA_13095 [Diplonema papillatum]|nr:hypothetical protein DIPPA_13095 [Diplonema papillatum]
MRTHSQPIAAAARLASDQTQSRYAGSFIHCRDGCKLLSAEYISCDHAVG